MDNTPHQKNPEPSGENRDTRTKDDLSELRNLLLKPEQTQLERLQQRLDDPRQQAREVSRVLPEAILLRSKEDQQITQTLTPILEEAVKTSVKKNPRILVNAIFPVIGPAIRKAIANTLRGMVQSFSQMLDQSFSLKGLKWRIEAFRTGKSFAEVVLLHTLVYRVEQVFLIHRDTGIALQHVAARGVVAQDPDLVSSMLTAIQDFIRDSFGEDRDGAVDTLQVGEHTVWIEEGPLAILAVVIRGHAPPELRTTLQDVIETVHFEQEDELERMHHRYIGAPSPRAGEKATAAYRLRLMYLDRWSLWRPLTRYRTWQGPSGETVDGTNNGCERAIGWWVKERYRTMRGYKRRKSAVNVSRLLAWCGNHLERGGADLSLLIV